MRSSKQIKKEIEKQFCFFPPFFSPAMDTPEVLENLWQQTLSAYVNNPLPALFKEKLFAYLSRYCSVPYCIICHSCALQPLAMSAGDVLELLERPTPFVETTINGHIGVLAAGSVTPGAWPDPGSSLEQSLFWCSVFTFLDPYKAEPSQHEILCLLGDRQYAHWSAFLSHIKTCHFWVETHPDLSYDADQRFKKYYQPLIKGEPRLEDFFQHYREKVVAESKKHEEHLSDKIIQIRLMEKELRESQKRFKLALEAVEEGLWDWNVKTNKIYFSPRWEALYGYKPGELEPHFSTLEKLVYPDDEKLVMKAFNDHVEGRTDSYNVEHRAKTKSGGLVWTLGRGKIVERDEEGKPL